MNDKGKETEDFYVYKMEEEMIMCVIEHELLYNLSFRDYHDINKKAHAWRIVAEQVGLSGE